MKFGSVCSGIEAASVALHRLGWSAAWFAEIEEFPSKVLAYRFPSVPNLGDMRGIAARVRSGEVEAPDALIGGTPCQSFSVAGLRAGLSDARGQLTYSYVELANAIDSTRAIRGERPAVIWWENVPGVLSSKDNAFGCFLAGLAGESCELQPAGGKWTDAGCVFGPERAVAWRVLDAQYIGLAQRRRRVFVIASADPGFDPATVLFEFDGVRRDTAPSRETWQETARTLAARTDGGGFPGTDEACAGYVQPSRVTVMAHGQGGAEISQDRSPTLTCNHEAPIAAYAFQPRIARNGRGDMGDVVNALTAQAGETGKGDAAPCVAVAFEPRYYTRDNKTGGAPSDTVMLTASPKAGDSSPHVAYAFSCKDYGADAGRISPTLRAMNHSGSHANAGGQVAVCIHGTQDPIVGVEHAHALGCNQGQENAVCITGDITHTLKAEGFDASEDGTGRGQPIVASPPDCSCPARDKSTAIAVRRLLPVECERLQGFPDNHTRIPLRQYAKRTITKLRPEDMWEKIDGTWWLMAADGPRYKALGNSMAVTVMHWIGRRITAELASLPDAR